MNVRQVMQILSEQKNFEVREVEYKEEFKDKYPLSFECDVGKDYVFVSVNGVEFKAKRIIEEFGYILFLHNFNQVGIKVEEIKTLEVLFN